MSYYLIQIYNPTQTVSHHLMVRFWLNRNASLARVALGVAILLTITTLIFSTNAAIPKMSYVKRIYVYLRTCCVKVFASLLEYAPFCCLGKGLSMREARKQHMAKMAQEHSQRCVAEAATEEGPERCPPPVAVLLSGNAEVSMVKSAVQRQPVSSLPSYQCVYHYEHLEQPVLRHYHNSNSAFQVDKSNVPQVLRLSI